MTIAKENRIDHMKYMPDMEIIESDVMDRVISSMNACDFSKFTDADVEAVLEKDILDARDFECLLSPAAQNHLEAIARKAQDFTRRHFGNSIYMFTPLYIANYCENYCIYCGFNSHNKIKRSMLDIDQIEKELKAIAESGLDSNR